MSTHIHGPYNTRQRVEMIKDLLGAPHAWEMSCKRGRTIIKWYLTRDEIKTMFKLQNEIIDYLNVPERKSSRELYRKNKKGGEI